MQKKRILKNLAKADDLFWERAETFSRGFASYLQQEGMTKEGAVDAYLSVCKDMLIEQTRFARSGVYRHQSAGKVDEIIYSNPDIMSYHMHGVALSEFLWPNHYAIYDFFCRHITEAGSAVQNYLEIGAGHGLFLAKALDTFTNAALTVIDISEVSINMCRRIIPHLSESSRNLHFYQQDVMTFGDTGTFDFITMGEVLEHVQDPKSLLDKLYALLNPDGRAFISTCCNCPAIDHVYLFRNIAEIQALFLEAGLYIQKEIVLPVEGDCNGPGDEKYEEINYAAIVARNPQT